MILGRVTGRITSTIHHPVVENQKLLVIDKLDAAGNTGGGYLIAMDTIGAGTGETVVVLDEGNGARQVLGLDPGAVRAVIVGVVDEVTLAA